MPVHAALQHTPSAQNPLAQSVPTVHLRPSAHLVTQVATEPPQSTSVSVPFFAVSSQESTPKHPSGMVPQVLVPQVSLVQPQMFCVPPPPHVFGGTQSWSVVQAQSPVAMQTDPPAAPHGVPTAFGVKVGTPPMQVSVVQ